MHVLNLIDQGPIAYLEADRLQRDIFDQVRQSYCDDTLLVFECESTYTAGRHTRPEAIIDADLPIIEADRAGSITWHGPGQLVIYPIVRLQPPIDLIAYIRAVEAAVLSTTQHMCGLPTERIDGRAGVWLREPDRKLCAIGLKVSQGATLHGLALNVNPDFSQAFSGIVPCGLDDAGVTSLEAESVHHSLSDIAAPLTEALTDHLTPLLWNTHQPSTSSTPPVPAGL